MKKFSLLERRLEDLDDFVFETYTQELNDVLDEFGVCEEQECASEGKDPQATMIWLLKEININLRTIAVILNETNAKN